jgi:HAMP domain-containing protein
VTKELVKLTRNLSTSLKRDSRKTPSAIVSTEESLGSLLVDCSSVGDELHAALSKLKLQPQEKRQKWGSIQRGLRSIWTQDEINGLERRLETFRQQISMHLLVSLRFVNDPLCLLI